MDEVLGDVPSLQALQALIGEGRIVKYGGP